jgi:hypothetical protein
MSLVTSNMQAAFPSVFSIPPDTMKPDGTVTSPSETQLFINTGMTLRDYFASQTLASVGTWTPIGFAKLTSKDALKARAEWAYAQADAMLAARENAA